MGFIDKNINDLELPKGVISLQQTYTKEEGIKDVLVFKTNNFADDLGGWFKETIRLNDEGQIISLKELGVSLRLGNQIHLISLEAVDDFGTFIPPRMSYGQLTLHY